MTDELLARALSLLPVEQLWEAILEWEPWLGESSPSSDTILSLASDSGLDFVHLGKPQGRNFYARLNRARFVLHQNQRWDLRRD